MRNVRARRNFTLLEMLIVMAIAMIMMGALVSGYQKIKHGQDLSLGASAVQGTLQSARAQAMQLGKVVHVYFLDGGKPETANSGTSYGKNFGLTYDGSLDTADKTDAYLRAYTTYDIPYELMITTADGQELSRTQLPNGVAWLSLGSGAGKYPGDGPTYVYAVNKEYNTQRVGNNGLGRNCSLIICFSPSGSSWPIAASARLNTIATDYKNTLTNLRIFMLDDLLLGQTGVSPAIVVEPASTPCAILTDFWKLSGGIIDNRPPTEQVGKNPNVYLNQLKWLTVKMNYTTGLCSTVDGVTGE